ncbi:MAG: adenosylhomocysteinase [Sulfolobales archaeon]|nr:adenosylhomocysteinase [Sulfolobales archaeon]
MSFKVKDLGLSSKGRTQIEWAEIHMPVLRLIREEFYKNKPLKGIRISAVLHVTKETAVLVKTLVDGGAEVWLAGSNPLSTQDDVAAALAEDGIHVYAWRGESRDEYYWCIERISEVNPHIVVDDGADLHAHIHAKNLTSGIYGGTEETTTGVYRLRMLDTSGKLRYPVIAVNDSYTKYLFDNRYGTGQSTVDGVLRATNILIAGKIAVVAGYGWVGRGIANRLRGMGARVVITEVNPIKALEAVMDGFEVMTINKACEVGDLFVTATGNINVVNEEQITRMKDGAILANAGHFNVEINVNALERISINKKIIRDNLVEYVLSNGRRIYLLAEGRLVNLVAAEGHPSEVMDLSFSNQAYAIKYLVENRGKLNNSVYKLPKELDELIAKLKLRSMGITIDDLSDEQRKYLSSWELGT